MTSVVRPRTLHVDRALDAGGRVRRTLHGETEKRLADPSGVCCEIQVGPRARRFWEFVAGPINAGTFGPNEVDRTFGPEVKFVSIPAGLKPNRPPTEGLQYFGLAKLDGASETLTVSLHDLTGRTLHTVDLQPA